MELVEQVPHAGGRCSIVGRNVLIAGAGSCTDTAAQAGDANYRAASSAPQVVAIGRKALTIHAHFDNLIEERVTRAEEVAPGGFRPLRRW
jgi:hypothetical protein